MNPTLALRVLRLVVLVGITLFAVNDWVILGVDKRGVWVIGLLIYVVTFVVEFRLRAQARRASGLDRPR